LPNTSADPADPLQKEFISLVEQLKFCIQKARRRKRRMMSEELSVIQNNYYCNT
jgi:hypothetical protein